MKIKGEFEAGSRIRVEKQLMDNVTVYQKIKGDWSKGTLYVKNTREAMESPKRYMAIEGTLATVTRVKNSYVEIRVDVHIVHHKLNKKPKYTGISSVVLRINR